MKSFKSGSIVKISFLGEILDGVITGKTEDGYTADVQRITYKHGVKQNHITKLNSIKMVETKGFSSFIVS